jgi:multicomponent Na+:H+ antiporter subunit G
VIHAVAVALVAAGTAVVITSSLGALVAKGVYHRLHFATPITSLGGPLIGLGLSVANGAGLTTASILLPTFLLFFASPVLSAAIARTLAQREGRIPSEPPE